MDPDVRFDPDAPFVPAAGAAGWATSTTSILALAPVAAALDIFDEIGMPDLRARSIRLTGDLEGRLDGLGVDIVTPRDPAARGAQLSLRFDDAGSVLHTLAARGVVADHRAPDLIRVAPIPSYTSYHDLWRFGEILRETIAGS